MSAVTRTKREWKFLHLTTRKGLRAPHVRTHGNTLMIALSMRLMSFYKREAYERGLDGPAQVVRDNFSIDVGAPVDIHVQLHKLGKKRRDAMIRRSFREPVVLERIEGKDCFTLFEGKVTAHLMNIMDPDTLKKFSAKADEAGVTPGQHFRRVLLTGIGELRKKVQRKEAA